MSNVEEFISEALSNKQFQARLLLIKSKKRRSIWSKFINAFAKLLSSFKGAKVDNNILSHILITT